MDLTWWWVVIVACVALAAVLVAASTRRANTDRTARPLANVERLTTLPAYLRVMRRRRVLTACALALLAVAFGSAVVSAARPTGLPGPARDVAAAQPEDVMVCLGAPDPVALRYFATRVTGYDTQRIGLTTPDRRVVPLTRDHQYAATRFADYARTSDTATIRYSDYAPTVEDALAMCITGFPSFDRIEPQRRSVIYIGPGARPDERPIYTVDAVRNLAATAGVQINAVMTDSESGTLEALARDTGGGYVAPGANVAVALDSICLLYTSPSPRD